MKGIWQMAITESHFTMTHNLVHSWIELAIHSDFSTHAVFIQSYRQKVMFCAGCEAEVTKSLQ